jgi:hypothetical protein
MDGNGKTGSTIDAGLPIRNLLFMDGNGKTGSTVATVGSQPFGERSPTL